MPIRNLRPRHTALPEKSLSVLRRACQFWKVVVALLTILLAGGEISNSASVGRVVRWAGLHRAIGGAGGKHREGEACGNAGGGGA